MTKKIISKTVQITLEDYERVLRKSKERYYPGSKDTPHTTEQSGEEINLQGMVAEVAVAKFLNVAYTSETQSPTWALENGIFGDLAHQLQVKSTVNKKHNLFISKSQVYTEETLFILAIVDGLKDFREKKTNELPIVTIVGWISGADIDALFQSKERVNDRIIRKEFLKPLDTLEVHKHCKGPFK